MSSRLIPQGLLPALVTYVGASADMKGRSVVAKICFVVISDTVDDSFSDLTRGLRAFCPTADIAWYNSGRRRPALSGVIEIPRSRPLKYAKITPAFFDVLEWAGEQDYDQVINVETDMAFIKPGFLGFIEEQMKSVDYLAPRLRYRTPEVTQWRPYRSLQGELPELLSILDMPYTNRCFNPGQVFSRRYISKLLSSEIYPEIRGFVERNQGPGRSYTLQEVILPTLADRLDLSSGTYPNEMAVFNRYRPYQGPYDLELARDNPSAYFLHPVRRSGEDAVRAFARRQVERKNGLISAQHGETGGGDV